MLSKLEQDMYKILAAFNTLEELGYEYQGGCKWELKEDSYEDGFEGLVYVEPDLDPETYDYVSIDMRKLTEEQLCFLKENLCLGDCDFEDKDYLTKDIVNSDENWFTFHRTTKYDKEISFNDIFKYK